MFINSLLLFLIKLSKCIKMYDSQPYCQQESIYLCIYLTGNYLFKIVLMLFHHQRDTNLFTNTYI